MSTHELKTIEPWFTQVWVRNKQFEIRENDRDFTTGDRVVLREYDAGSHRYGRRSIEGIIKRIFYNVPNVASSCVVMLLFELQNKEAAEICFDCDKLILMGEAYFRFYEDHLCYECDQIRLRKGE